MRLKIASRTRSPVGRVSIPLGAKIRAPLREPAMILTQPLRVAAKRLNRVAVVLLQLLCPSPRLRDQLPVADEARELQVGEARLPRPEQLALAAQLQVDPRELEPVRDVDERLEPPLRVVGELLPRPRDEQAVRLLRAAADATAQLVQLRKAEPVGLLDDHDRRVRDVDADLDDGRRHEDVEIAPLELVHDGTPLRGAHSPVEAADAELAELRAPQAVGLLFGR